MQKFSHGQHKKGFLIKALPNDDEVYQTTTLNNEMVSQQKTATSVEGKGIDVSACASQNWVSCSVSVGNALYNWITNLSGWKNGRQTIPAFRGTCIGEYKGGFHNWQWKYNGKFSCDHVSKTIVGYSSKFKSRSGAIKQSIQDFIQKAGRAGVLTPEQIAAYNSG
ncbi:unnamed protein product [Rotaria socialis]|uniref:Uncharacterized protein n=1 Tax=Rotaria socialis TaxID=392032 RepID=A0A821PHW9_9BILA|nr:unnamed protein product [Rotaria socialis]